MGRGLTMPITNRNPVGPVAGTVAHFAASTAPAGWLKCNGALISRTAYAALFAAVGTTYGVGDGATTFAVPDLRGEFLRGLDDGRGVDSARAIGSAQDDQIKSHAHSIFAGANSTSAHNTKTLNNNSSPQLNDVGLNVRNNGTANEGGTENRPRNVAMLACIKF